MRKLLQPFLVAGFLHVGVAPASELAGAAHPQPLAVVREGRAVATVVLSPAAGEQERAAARDLVHYVERITGARLPTASAAGSGPAIFIGQAALRSDPTLHARLRAAAKQNPVVNSDAIVIRRSGQHLYVAGNNDQAHYFAVSQLLQEWGCRWYMPTEFGEVVPEHRNLMVGSLDRAHGSPFEIRSYWLSFLADDTGREEFQRRNFATAVPLPANHALARYTTGLMPPGTSPYRIPLSEPETAAAVARQIEAEYAKGLPGISLAIEDGIYRSESSSDRALEAGIFDKYMLRPSTTDAMISLYNNVGRLLREKHPHSRTLLTGLAYSNVTLPPQRMVEIEPNVMIWLAPIDIDPNHSMDDPQSPSRQEYKAMMYRWAELLKGRLAIYDYDQGQLVWRDIPNPSHHVFAQDVRHYRNAGALGVWTESRGATATTFLNLHLRLQLLWNPDADVDALIADFYPRFYGPAAAPMADYWNAIFSAWKQTHVTEHEYFIAPAIYTPELVSRLSKHLARALEAIAPLQAKASPSRNEQLYMQRMQFTALSFAVIENYLAMVRSAATEGEYRLAAAAGERALQARERLTAMNPTFTTYKKMGEKGAAWLPGEVEQMRELAGLVDGTHGALVTKLPLSWAFRTDPHDTGLARGWAYTPSLLLSRASGGRPAGTPSLRSDDGWEMLRSDLYMQAQGVRHADRQSYTGYYWYQTEIELTVEQAAGDVHILFPGLFNDTWLYVNGKLVAHRAYAEPWWRGDYRLEWDVPLRGELRAGRNLLTVRGANPHHYGGMFRRPFLYRAISR